MRRILLAHSRKKGGTFKYIATAGIALAKHMFQLHGVDARGRAVLSKEPIAYGLFGLEGECCVDFGNVIRFDPLKAVGVYFRFGSTAEDRRYARRDQVTIASIQMDSAP